MIFQEIKCIINDDCTKELIVEMPRSRNNMFPLDLTRTEKLNLVVKKRDESELWHRCFGHLNYRILESLAQKKIVCGLLEVKHGPQCFDYKVCKQERSSFPSKKSRRTTTCLQLIHMDFCGPINTDSLGGNKYFLLLNDYFSRKCWVYFLNNKGEAFDHFQKFHTLVERETGKKLNMLRSDHREGFTSHVFNNYCEELGVKREFSAPYTR